VNAGHPLSGSFTNASGSLWSSSGNGTFSPVPDSLIATYNPDTFGIDTITLTTTGSCNNSSDEMILTITGAPVVDAGPDVSICDTFGIALNGTVTIAGGGTWTTNGAGAFSPSADSLNTTYIPDAGDTALASLVLTLTSTGNGDCNPVADSLVVIFPSVIYVNAGVRIPLKFLFQER